MTDLEWKDMSTRKWGSAPLHRNGASVVVTSELNDQYTGLHGVPSDHA